MSDIDAAFHHLDEHTNKLHMHMQLLDNYLPRLDELATRLDAVERNKLQANNPDFSPRDPYHASGVHTLVKLWPSIDSLLYSAHFPVDPGYVLASEAKDVHISPRPYAPHTILPRDPVTSHAYALNDLPTADAMLDRKTRIPSPDGNNSLRLLFRSYVDNMHSLHPFVDLDDALHSFEHLFGDNFHPPLSYPDEMSEPTHRPVKRPRVDHMSFGHGGSIAPPSRAHKPSPLETARLYLILALGDICAHKRGLVFSPRSKVQSLAERTGRSGSFQSDATLVDDGLVSPLSANPPTPQGFADGGPADVPGANFYDQATRIAGPFQGGNDLIHAQIALLAGLYKAQIGQVRESFNWISSAGRSVLHLLRRFHLLANNSDMPLHDDSPETRGRAPYQSLQKRVKSAEHDLVVLAAWSCIQLEGDILAELPYPESGILACEDLLPWPTRIPGGSQFYKTGALSSHDVLMYFSSQLWLRKRLNLIQNQLHGGAGKLLSTFALRQVLCEHHVSLTSWRSGLPIHHGWLDNEPPPADIHTARLRAKYWSACFLADRPYLDCVLHEMAFDAYGHSRTDTGSRLFDAISTLPEAQKMQGAQRCVQAAFQSARAFDGINQALIDPNMHGTAHAYDRPNLVNTPCIARLTHFPGSSATSSSSPRHIQTRLSPSTRRGWEFSSPNSLA